MAPSQQVVSRQRVTDHDEVYKFKRYEDASLEYTGLNRHAGQAVGLHNTALSLKDYAQMNRL